jgi:hypothetical protein
MGEVRDIAMHFDDLVINMHFDDLVIKLRTQALAGVAALSTLVGIFAKYQVGSVAFGVVQASPLGFNLSVGGGTNGSARPRIGTGVNRFTRLQMRRGNDQPGQRRITNCQQHRSSNLSLPIMRA